MENLNTKIKKFNLKEWLSSHRMGIRVLVVGGVFVTILNIGAYEMTNTELKHREEYKKIYSPTILEKSYKPYSEGMGYIGEFVDLITIPGREIAYQRHKRNS